jgi:hypothetical protein
MRQFLLLLFFWSRISWSEALIWSEKYPWYSTLRQLANKGLGRGYLNSKANRTCKRKRNPKAPAAAMFELLSTDFLHMFVMSSYD